MEETVQRSCRYTAWPGLATVMATLSQMLLILQIRGGAALPPVGLEDLSSDASFEDDNEVGQWPEGAPPREALLALKSFVLREAAQAKAEER
jgi:hypothetical protein